MLSLLRALFASYSTRTPVVATRGLSDGERDVSGDDSARNGSASAPRSGDKEVTPGKQEQRKVLLSAFSCWPGLGSEPGVGWNWAIQAGRHHRVWVLTLSEGREDIKARRDEWEPLGITFVYWDVPLWPHRLIHPRDAVRLYYLLWQITVLFVAFRLHRRVGFDAVHQVTLNTIEVPGFLWLLDAPFYWGPVGGAQEPPASLRQYFGRGWRSEVLRILRKRLVLMNPIVRLAIRKATRVLAANQDTARLLNRCGAENLIHELETAIDPRTIRSLSHSQSQKRNGLTVVWAGRFISRKGPLLAIDAIAELRRRGVPVTLRMAGDGPLEDAVAHRIKEHDLQSSVERLGSIPYERMSELYSSGDVFLFTSLHDTSGNVLLEAMAHGLPVVTLDHQGAGEIVAKECGIKVPIGDESSVVNGLADALAALASDPKLRQALGQAGRQRVNEHYVWSRKGRVLETLYEPV